MTSLAFSLKAYDVDSSRKEISTLFQPLKLGRASESASENSTQMRQLLQRFAFI